jgi:hypothetical protein
MKAISTKARAYFFLPKNASKELKAEKMLALLEVVEKEVAPVISACEDFDAATIKKMPWNQRRTIEQIKGLARQYLKDVRTFLMTGIMVPTKILSFHLKEAVCFTKGKPGKKYQFGRCFQLGRIVGNFIFVGQCLSIQMPDKTSLGYLIAEHESLFSGQKINSATTDKGYYSFRNEKLLVSKGVSEIGIQRPSNIKKNPPQPITEDRKEQLNNRRSGIEPLIGHLKQGGQLGRSRMKSDKTIECSGYTAVLGFNMRQLIRHQKGKYRDKAA